MEEKDVLAALPIAANEKMQEADMRNCGVLIATLIVPALMATSPNSLEAADESPFFLQDHGGVRVLRGLDPGKNFETARLPEELDLAPAAAPEPQLEPRRTRTQVEPRLTTRELALRRARERGITVHGPFSSGVRGPESGRTRREAVDRARERGVAG
jgi:pyruvate/2-oxoglutarate dehydrogenase complex dihydrolipoamide acyltransferase (E2) component